MFPRIALVSLLAAVPLVAVSSRVAGQQEEKPKVPKDSVLVVVTGCVKGRALRSSDVRQTDTTSGVNVRNQTFRLSGKKDVMSTVKENDGGRVEVTGLIKKSALIEPGMKFKGGRIRIGGGTSGGAGSSLPDPAENVVVLDVSAVQALPGSCGG
jgi:hypothetical protein